MNVRYFLIVTICVLQVFWSAVGLKLPLSNITTKSSARPVKAASSSPTLKNSTPTSDKVSDKSIVSFAPKTSISVDQPESKQNSGNAFDSSSRINNFLSTSLSSTSSPNLFNRNSVKETESLKLGTSATENLNSNNNLKPTVQNSLNILNNNFISPQSSSPAQSNLVNEFSSSKNDVSSTKNSLKNKILPCFTNTVPLKTGTGNKDNFLSSPPNVGIVSSNEFPSALESLQPNNLYYNLQQSQRNKEAILNTIDNNLKRNLLDQRYLDSSAIQPTKFANNVVNNLESLYAGPSTNIQKNDFNPFPQYFGSLQSNILTDSQINDHSDFEKISTQYSLNPSAPTLFGNTHPSNLNPARNSLIQSKTESETKFESPLSTNPYKTLTATAQNDILNRTPNTKNNESINKYNKNILLEQLNNIKNTIPNHDLQSKNIPYSQKPTNTFLNNELQFNDIESYRALQNLLQTKVAFDSSPNLLPINTGLGRINTNHNFLNDLSNDVFINNENLQIARNLQYNNPNILNAPYLESSLMAPDLLSDVTITENRTPVLSNNLPNIFPLPHLNNFNNIPQPSPPITPYFPKASNPFYPDFSTSNILQQANFKNPPQISTLPLNDVVHSSLFQSVNSPVVEMQSPNTLPGIINMDKGSSLPRVPRPNLDLINRINVLENLGHETFYLPSPYPEFIGNLNSMPKQSLLPYSSSLVPQNEDLRIFDVTPQFGINSQIPFNNIIGVTSPYLTLNSNPYTPPNSLEVYNYLSSPINTDTSINANTVSKEILSGGQNFGNSLINSTELETVSDIAPIYPYSIPSISDLPNVLASNYLSLPQALLYNKISPSNLVVPQIENLISTTDLTKSIIDLGNDVARRWIDNLWAKKAMSSYQPLYNQVLPTPNNLPAIAETFVSSPNISPIISTQSPLPTVPSVVSVSPPNKDTVKEVEPTNQFLLPSSSMPKLQKDESQAFFLPTFFPAGVPVYSPSVLPTPIINYPVYPPYIPTPTVNFPPIPPFFPPMPSIIETPVLKMGSGSQDSRKLIELLLFASLLNNNDCNDRGALETLIALMFAT